MDNLVSNGNIMIFFVRINASTNNTEALFDIGFFESDDLELPHEFLVGFDIFSVTVYGRSAYQHQILPVEFLFQQIGQSVEHAVLVHQFIDRFNKKDSALLLSNVV